MQVIVRKLFTYFVFYGLALCLLERVYPGLVMGQSGTALAMSSSNVWVAIDTSSPALTSQFTLGVTSADTNLSYQWLENMRAMARSATVAEKKNSSLFNVQIMGWGVDDPWPDPAQKEPGNWQSLDSRLRIALMTGATPVLTLCEAPWWMKGQLQANGRTKLLTQNEEFSDTAYNSRILDNKMDSWLHLVRRVAERYMAPPYNVRYFQVWNELKGYYNPGKNSWDYSTSAGDPSGPHAEHGYTYMYNRVYTTLKKVAAERGIEPTRIKVGGPYVAMDTWSSNNQSNPSNFVRPYGAFDQRSLDVLKYWFRYKVGADFITLSGHNKNRGGPTPPNPFLTSNKFADVVRWIRSLNNALYPGSATLPIWWAEWYADPFTDITAAYEAAVKSYAMIELIKAGGSVALLWGDDATWVMASRGSAPLPWYYSFKALNNDFGMGTPIYRTTSSSSLVEVLASFCQVMLVNQSARNLSVSVGGTVVQLAPYEVRVVPVISSKCRPSWG